MTLNVGAPKDSPSAARPRRVNLSDASGQRVRESHEPQRVAEKTQSLQLGIALEIFCQLTLTVRKPQLIAEALLTTTANMQPMSLREIEQGFHGRRYPGGADSSSGSYDPDPDPRKMEGQQKNLIQYSNASIRRAFVRKVYAVLAVMLAVNFGLSALAALSQQVKDFVINHSWTYYIAYVIFIVVYIIIACCTSCRRSFPCNVICLVLLTFSMSYMCMMVSAFHKTSIVFMAMGICMVCCVAVTLFAINTKYDFTSCLGVLFVVSIVLMLVGVVAVILMYVDPKVGKPVYAVYAGLAAIVFMVFLAVDTQMVMGGKQHEISEEDWVYAATQLFCDIVYIFIFLMEVMGMVSR